MYRYTIDICIDILYVIDICMLWRNLHLIEVIVCSQVPLNFPLNSQQIVKDLNTNLINFCHMSLYAWNVTLDLYFVTNPCYLISILLQYILLTI